jgi:hypothetical protein
MEAIRLNATNTVERLHRWTTEELQTGIIHAMSRIALAQADVEKFYEELGRRGYEA